MRQRHISGLFPEERPTHQTGAWRGHLDNEETKMKATYCLLCEWSHIIYTAQQNKEWRPETSWTFKSSSRVFQLQRTVVQQLPPSDQVLFSKHLAALHPHDRLTVSATGDHRKHTPCSPFTHLSLVHAKFQRSTFWTSWSSCFTLEAVVLLVT